MTKDLIDIVVPVHNEAESIADTLSEFYMATQTAMTPPIRFVVCEDGSTDRTVEVLEEAARTLPIHLITQPQRKGYSQAVIDGLRASTSHSVAVIDSDGQCDPADFPRLLQSISHGDVVIGYRHPRVDPWARLAMSNAFKAVYQTMFSLRLKDPSCPYIVIRRPALDKILAGNPGILPQGFWWEFMARADANHLKIIEVPVNHRVRASGTTQVYRPRKIPKIAAEHLVGLYKLKRSIAIEKR